jgi:hypothetical protein
VEFRFEEDDGQNGNESWEEVEQKRHQSRRGIFDGGQVAIGLSDTAKRTHADRSDECAAARQEFTADNQQTCHEDGGKGETQKGQGKGIQPTGVGVAAKDGQCPK